MPRVALTHGVFDLLHAGHIDHIEQASLICDRLIVSVVADKFVTKRFIINDERTRMFQVARVKGVFDVVLCEDFGPWNLIRKLRPDIYVRKEEYADKTQPEYALAEELGIACRFTRDVFPHAKEIIQRIWSFKGQYD